MLEASSVTDAIEQAPGNDVDTGASGAERRSLRPKAHPTIGSSTRSTFDEVAALRVEGMSISAIARAKGIPGTRWTAG